MSAMSIPRFAASALLATAAAIPAAAAAPMSGVTTPNMDPQVQPGDDFFRFVNGAWLERTAIPPDRSSYGAFTILQDRTQDQLRVILEEVLDAPGDAESEQLAALYASYLDTDTIERRGMEPVKALLARIDGVQDRAALSPLLAELLRDGITVPLNLSIYRDARHPERYALYISQSGLGLPDREFYLGDSARFQELRPAYRAHVEHLLALAGYRDAATRARHVLALETRLAEAHWTRVASRDREATYNPATFAELPEIAPGIDWGAFFDVLGARPDRAIVSQPEAIAAAAELVATAPLPELRSWLSYHVLAAFAPYLSSPFEEEHFAFYNATLRGAERPLPRWRRALTLVDAGMGEALGKRYVARHFPEESRARMETMVDYLLRAYEQRIRELNWMGEDTRAQALDKLAAFSVKIGYPKRWRDYSALEVDAEDLFGNVRRAYAHRFAYHYDKLGRPVDEDEWFMPPQTVNAYYSPGGNEIVFPAAILQPPFFDPRADDAVNYGAIGGVIGHEIGHGFDDQGSRFDGEGRMRNWWTEEDRAGFEERTSILVEQYNQFCPLEGHCVNGALSLGENIGDLGGLGIAEVALQLALADSERRGSWRQALFRGDLRLLRRPTISSETIDGFTPEQRFFIGWGQVWAWKAREAELINRLNTGPHSPAEFRTNGVVRNIDAWYRAFAVRPEHALYLPPEDRVVIWQ